MTIGLDDAASPSLGAKVAAAAGGLVLLVAVIAAGEGAGIASLFWGGETPGVGFDCSGLVQAAYKVAGIALPRVAQDQYDAGPHVPGAEALEPGDLVFFACAGGEVDHVGLYVGTEGGKAVMVDAPHTGADVRVEPFPTTLGSAFGDLTYAGATRPAA